MKCIGAVRVVFAENQFNAPLETEMDIFRITNQNRFSLIEMSGRNGENSTVERQFAQKFFDGQRFCRP